ASIGTSKGCSCVDGPVIRRSLLLLGAVAATAAFLGLAAASSATRLPVIRLPAHSGWHVISTGSNPKPPSSAEVMAATIPLRHDPEGANTLPPHWALERLTGRGIILQAGNYGRGHLKNHPQRRPPLTILH